MSEIVKPLQPSARAKLMQQRRSYNYQTALILDRAAVEQFSAYAEARRTPTEGKK